MLSILDSALYHDWAASSFGSDRMPRERLQHVDLRRKLVDAMRESTGQAKSGVDTY